MYFRCVPATQHENMRNRLACSLYLYINSGRWYLCHVPNTFATVNTHANVFLVFLSGGISKEWRHIVSANCDFEVCRFRCAGKVQKNYGSDVRGKCKRITLTLSSVLTYQCMYVGLCIMHGLRQRGQRAEGDPPPPGEWGGPPPTLDIPVPSLTFGLQISPPTLK